MPQFYACFNNPCKKKTVLLYLLCMQVRINRFFFDGKDIFIVIFGLFLLLHYYFQLHFIAFLQYQSLIVLFFFLLTIRTLATQTKLSEYLAIVLSGILFSFFLSPIGIFIYLLSAVLLYTKFL